MSGVVELMPFVWALPICYFAASFGNSQEEDDDVERRRTGPQQVREGNFSLGSDPRESLRVMKVNTSLIEHCDDALRRSSLRTMTSWEVEEDGDPAIEVSWSCV